MADPGATAEPTAPRQQTNRLNAVARTLQLGPLFTGLSVIG
jgi:hypothetical protein